MENDTRVALATQVKELNLEKPAFSMLVKPVVSNQEILSAWKAYEELKLKLLTRDDFATIQGKEFAKKSAYRKLALAFGVSVEITSEKRIELPGNAFAYEITAKAISPNARFMTAVGSAHSNEKKFSKPSDVRAFAQTRATNRATSDLLGGVLGVSAEEVVAEAEQAKYEPFTNEQPEEEQTDDSGIDSTVLDRIFDKRNTEDDVERITDKQSNLIVKLADQKFYNNESARSYYLRNLGGLSKQEASSKIGELLRA